ncbi:MAG: type II toxin-antitoxin system VapC family toxin [Acidobacteria bacterium]|nr:type II toxin-antitoxin system VapC family toxin [Acidobacteriota bacterium]
MVIDTSAILAILFGEPERGDFAEAIASAPTRLVGSVTALEAAVVVASRKGPAGSRELDLLFHQAGIDIVAFSEDHLRIARKAYEAFGKGRHPASLNLGDCCSYALAKLSGEPLLFKGDDFSRTDIPSVL